MRKWLAGLLALGAMALAPSASAAPDEFVGPLFGVTTGHSGALLVADAGQGIVRRSAGETRLIAHLLGATDVEIRSRGSLWGLTSVAFGGDSALWIVRHGQAPRKLIDLQAFENRHNPHPATTETDPFDVLNRRGGRAIVADAAGNDVIHVGRSGRGRLIAVLPNEVVPTANAKRIVGCPNPDAADICNLPARIPAEAVATSVTPAPDGGIFVGELKGFPAPRHHSRVWHIDPGTRGAHCGQSPHCQLVFDDFTSIIDLRWFRGRLYVAQIDDASWFAMENGVGIGGSVHSCNVATHSCRTVVSDKPMLTSITFRRNGSMWGITNALTPQADVVRLRRAQ